LVEITTSKGSPEDRPLTVRKKVADLFEDPTALVPQKLDETASRRYEELTVESLRHAMLPDRGGLVVVDAIELVGSRPDTLVVFRYHHRDKYVGRAPGLDAGPRAEVMSLWDYAIDDDPWSRGMMDGPAVLAAAIGSAFEAAELTLVDPNTLHPIGSPPKVFPRLYVIPGK
jgi:hypothetical protein